MSNPLGQDGTPRTIAILLCVWLLLALAVAAGIVLGTWALLQIFAGLIEGAKV